MNKNSMKEIGMLCGKDSILVICKQGIYRLFCPFEATCVIDVESYSIGDVVTVIAVKMSQDYKLVYIIQDKGYFHSSFVIISTPNAISTGFN